MLLLPPTGEHEIFYLAHSLSEDNLRGIYSHGITNQDIKAFKTGWEAS